MTATTQVPLLSLSANGEKLFPTLTAAQLERVAAHGHLRTVDDGEVLIQAGASNAPMFVVKSGTIEIVQVTELGEALLVLYHAGQFTGEINTLVGRRAMVRIRAREGGEVASATSS